MAYQLYKKKLKGHFFNFFPQIFKLKKKKDLNAESLLKKWSQIKSWQ